MINLIPNEEKKNKVRDFYFRFFILFLLIISCSFIIASVVLVPSYFISSLKKDLVNQKLVLQKNTPIPEIDKATSTQIALLDNQLSIIEKANKNKYLVSIKIINEIVLKKMPDIKINGISYENDSVLGKSVNIRGIAISRERLLLFRRALEEDEAFKKVDLPISNFVKGSNISFELSLIPS